MEWTIIDPDRTQPEKRTVTKTYPGAVKEEHFGSHFCPCCYGYGPGEGVSLCRYCNDGECGDERRYYDEHNTGA